MGIINENDVVVMSTFLCEKLEKIRRSCDDDDDDDNDDDYDDDDSANNNINNVEEGPLRKHECLSIIHLIRLNFAFYYKYMYMISIQQLKIL